MAVARQGQSNAMLYTTITFVALFLVAAILAVVFYIKAEDWRNQYQVNLQDMEAFASESQMRNVNTIIGQKDGRKSRLEQLISYIDRLYITFTGLAATDELSAEVKIDQLTSQYEDALAQLPEAVAGGSEPNGHSVLRVLEVYNNKFAQTNAQLDALASQMANLQNDYDIVKKGAIEREQELRTQIASEQQKADDVQQSYNQLRALMDQKTEEQVQTLMQQRDEAIEEKTKTRQELLEALSKLSITKNRLADALSRLEILKPRPMEDIAAYQPDGRIITMDTSSNIVFINIGSDDKVYPGLTFSVYDKSAPIPTDGASKAEIEVFDVDKNTSIARINKSSRNNPILEDDIVLNLIWDSKETNRFVIAGQFDLNGDGLVDSDGAVKIKQLVENWGGQAEEAVSIDTDFVVLGVPPAVGRKPSLDEIEMDPMAMDKYEQSLQESEKYQNVKEQAKDLYIPIFGLKRFLNFIGYESVASGGNY